MIKPTFKLEKELAKKNYNFIIGIDEAGRGPLAGPVVACAAVYKNSQLTFSAKTQSSQLDLIRDSKTLSEKQRESLYDFILENFYIGIGSCDHKTIDRINILQASFLAMKKAISDLMKNKKFFNHQTKNKFFKAIILVDGNKKIPYLSLEQRAIVSGDQKVKTISAASIIAKVTRDRFMREAHKIYPAYGFDKHKGYGTKAHREALKKYGPCAIHRRSFKPVKKLFK